MWDPVENNEASSTSDYVANSSCTDSTNSDEMEYDSEVLEKLNEYGFDNLISVSHDNCDYVPEP